MGPGCCQGARADAARPRQPARRRPPRVVRKRGPWQPLEQPHAAESQYRQALFALLEEARREVEKVLAPVYALLKKEAAEKERQDAPSKATVRLNLEAASRRVLAKVPASRATELAGRFASATQRAHQKAIQRQFAQTLGINVFETEPEIRPIVERFTRENVDRIQSLPRVYLGEVEKKVMQALESGARPESLAGWLQERFQVSKSKAAFIANDQAGKLYSSLTAARHQALGIKRYTWRTMKDGRVRPEHVVLEGDVFSYDTPHPEEGHPGDAPNCRCWQEPVLSDVLGTGPAVQLELESQDPTPRLEPGASVSGLARTVPTVAVERPRWTRERVYEVPVEELDDVPATAWDPGRTRSLENVHGAGKWEQLPPVKVTSSGQGHGRELEDGNHRLELARRLGLKTIKVRFLDPKAAKRMARPLRGEGWLKKPGSK